MSAFNRLVMLALALLLLAIPVLLLGVTFGVVPAGQVDALTGYRGAVEALSGSPVPETPSPALRAGVAATGALVAIMALVLLLRELTFGRLRHRSVLVEDEPGRETRITAAAVRTLAEGAAREAGAESPSVSLSSSRSGAYRVDCRILVPEGGDYTGTASRCRENISKELERQNVPVRGVEVTVRGAAQRYRGQPRTPKMLERRTA